MDMDLSRIDGIEVFCSYLFNLIDSNFRNNIQFPRDPHLTIVDDTKPHVKGNITEENIVLIFEEEDCDNLTK
jgi:hypothetical protein